MKTTRNTSKTTRKNEVYILQPSPDRGRVTRASWQRVVEKRARILSMKEKLVKYQDYIERAERELEYMQDEFFRKLEHGAYLESGYLTKDLSK